MPLLTVALHCPRERTVYQIIAHLQYKLISYKSVPVNDFKIDIFSSIYIFFIYMSVKMFLKVLRNSILGCSAMVQSHDANQ